MTQLREIISLRFSRTSEANASEFQEELSENVFGITHTHTHSDI